MYKALLKARGAYPALSQAHCGNDGVAPHVLLLNLWVHYEAESVKTRGKGLRDTPVGSHSRA